MVTTARRLRCESFQPIPHEQLLPISHIMSTLLECRSPPPNGRRTSSVVVCWSRPSDVLPLNLSAFNAYHHGGKVNAQDHAILREAVQQGEAEGADVLVILSVSTTSVNYGLIHFDRLEQFRLVAYSTSRPNATRRQPLFETVRCSSPGFPRRIRRTAGVQIGPTLRTRRRR
jgi:hypothetical protein